MSRVGKLPISVPSGVTATVNGSTVNVVGPKGKLEYNAGTGVKILVDAGKIVISAEGESKQVRANYGTTRSNINNMVIGVTQGWKRTLEMNGVGFTAKLAGQVLTLACGFSHDVNVEIPQEVKCAVTKSTIDLESADKLAVSTLARKIRDVQPPEPYLGKGIKFSTETVRRKAGKTGKK